MHAADATPVTTDPVCGMAVRPDGQHRLSYQGKTYLFCSGGCLAEFQAAPERYLRAASGEGGSAAPGTGATDHRAKRLHMSHASRDSATRAGKLSELRDGPRAYGHGRD